MAAEPVKTRDRRPISPQAFSGLLSPLLPSPAPRALAVAVSGGPDSMALAFLLSRTFKGTLHGLIVDHGLRAEARAEALAAKKILASWEGVKPVILKWEGPKPASRVQEAARAARYRLMAGYCARHKIGHLCLAHHLDDQAETILFRLAKGSGLDGLTGMRAAQPYQDENSALCLLRPLLGVSKESLIKTCRAHEIEFVLDPINKNLTQARPRMRQSASALAAEGLTPERLSTLALRLDRGRQALDHYAAQEAQAHALDRGTQKIVYRDCLLACPAEILTRIILKDMVFLAGKRASGYGPRLERVESLVEDLLAPGKFRKRTLGGVIFTRAPASRTVTLQKEAPFQKGKATV